jgi:hypothetical protein
MENFNKEELQFLLVIVNNQIDMQKLYRKKIKKKKNDFLTNKEFEKTENTLKELSNKIKTILDVKEVKKENLQ